MSVHLRPSHHRSTDEGASPLQVGGADAGEFRREPVFGGYLPVDPDAVMRLTVTRSMRTSHFESGPIATRPATTGERGALRLTWTALTDAELESLRTFEAAVRQVLAWSLKPNADDEEITVVSDAPMRVTQRAGLYDVALDVREVF
jgi:hypothetical protein